MRDCVRALASSVLLFVLRAMLRKRAKRQTRRKLETTCWAGEQGEGKWLSLSL